MINKNIDENFDGEDLNEREEAYRRGYSQGFWAARNNPDLSFWEVSAWRHSTETTAPPGSGMAGMHLDGLTKADEHRFFINRFTP